MPCNLFETVVTGRTDVSFNAGELRKFIVDNTVYNLSYLLLSTFKYSSLPTSNDKTDASRCDVSSLQQTVSQLLNLFDNYII